MGNCTSCLGQSTAHEEEGDAESRLLFDDADGTNYGSFGDAYMHDRDEEQESQREAEALQNVVTRTADNMVDVFEITPHRHGLHGMPAPYTLGMPGHQFENLLLKLSETDDVDADEDDEYGEYTQAGAYPPPGHSGFRSDYHQHALSSGENTVIDMVDVETVDESKAAQATPTESQAAFRKLLAAKADAAGLLVGNFTDDVTDP